MSRLRTATDSVKELFALTAVVLVLATVGYELVEGKGWFTSFWWSVVTGATVGYGDVYPVTLWGRIVAMVLIGIMVLFIVPLITARMASYMIVNNDAWTNAEQEQIKTELVKIRTELVGLREELRNLSEARDV